MRQLSYPALAMWAEIVAHRLAQYQLSQAVATASPKEFQKYVSSLISEPEEASSEVLTPTTQEEFDRLVKNR